MSVAKRSPDGAAFRVTSSVARGAASANRLNLLKGAMTVNETGEYGTSGGARDAGRKIGEEMKAGAREAVEVGKERTRSFLEDQKATVAGQMEDLATMLRRAAREHDEDGGRGASARLAERAADGMESIAESLQQRDLRGLVRNCEDFARRSPAVFIGGALTAGFLLTRFFKSSRERHEDDELGERQHEFGAGTAGTAGTGLGSTYPPTTTTTSPAGRAY
jgi:hypothetical protein